MNPSVRTTEISSATINSENFEDEQDVSGNPKLLRIHPVDSGTGLIDVDSDPFTFGRDTTCNVTISDDSASRQHAKIEQNNGDWIITDLDSTNGTWVNDERTEMRMLIAGDTFRVGRWSYKFFDAPNVEAKYHESVYEMMTKDKLTGAWNKRYLNDILEREVSQHKRSGQPICLLMIDIDYFKTINDENGHHVGDEVLTEFGKRVDTCVRTSDVFCRFGGDEFAVLLPNTDREAASVVANRILESVSEVPFQTSAGELTCTISCGFAQCNVENSMTRDEFMELADKRLYEAKQSGRKRVVG